MTYLINPVAIKSKSITLDKLSDEIVHYLSSIYVVVNELPTVPLPENKDKIHLVRNTETENNNEFVEYLYINTGWEKFGQFKADIDLSGYCTLNRLESELETINAEFNSLNNNITNCNNDITQIKNEQDVTSLAYKVKILIQNVNTNQTNINNLLNNDLSINGSKTFVKIPKCSVVPTLDNDLANKKYVDDNITNVNNEITSAKNSISEIKLNYVDKFTNQTINGVKTFSASPIVPTPVENTEVANKKYVDDADATIKTSISTLQSSLSTTNSNVNSLTQKVSANETNITALQTKANTNSTNITNILNRLTSIESILSAISIQE